MVGVTRGQQQGIAEGTGSSWMQRKSLLQFMYIVRGVGLLAASLTGQVVVLLLAQHVITDTQNRQQHCNLPETTKSSGRASLHGGCAKVTANWGYAGWKRWPSSSHC